MKESVLEEVKQDLLKPVPEHNAPSKEKKMAKKVEKKGKAEVEEKTKSKSKAKSKPAKADEDGNVTLAELASEAGISAAAARRKVRATEIERDGRWAFKEGSKQLKTVREALGI